MRQSIERRSIRVGRPPRVLSVLVVRLRRRMCEDWFWAEARRQVAGNAPKAIRRPPNARQSAFWMWG